MELFEKYSPVLMAYLDQKRYNHSMYVSFKCREFAEKMGIDKDKAQLAGMLHDITKNFSKEEHFELFEKYNAELSPIEEKTPNLWHAISGSLYVKNVLHIDDDEVINAIKYHTTARRNMTDLEKLLYLADYIADDRTFDEVEYIRSMANEDFEEALLYSLKLSINYLMSDNKLIHPGTLDAYNDIINYKERIS